MITDFADSTDISRTSVYKILRQNLEMKKVCSKLVCKVMMLEQKKERVFIAEMLDPTVPGWIITGDEQWVFEYHLFTKCQSSDVNF